jgi:MFS family permease
VEDLELSDVSLSFSRTSSSAAAPNTGQTLTWVIFFLLGLGNLLPWNAFITASAYYKKRFCGAAFEDTFESFFSMFYTVSQPIGLILTLLYAQKYSMKTLVLYPLIAYSVVFILITILAGITTVKPEPLFLVSLLGISICGFCGAVMNGGLFALAGVMPSKYTSALMNGSGLAGFSISALSLLIVASDPTPRNCSNDDNSNDDDGSCDTSTIDISALTFYSISSALLVCCIFAFLFLLRLDYVRFFLKLFFKNQANLELTDDKSNIVQNPMTIINLPEKHKSDVPNDSISNIKASESAPGNSDLSGSYSHSFSHNSKKKVGGSRVFTEDVVDILIDNIGKVEENTITNNINNTTNDNNVNHNNNTNQTRANTATNAIMKHIPSKLNKPNNNSDADFKGYKEILSILYEIRSPAYSVFITFGGTLFVFPSLMVLIESTSSFNSKYNAIFISILFTFYNLFDYLGRLTAPIIEKKSRDYITPNNIWIYANIRLILPLLLCFSNIPNNQLIILFPNDIATYVILLLIGYSNGFLANLSMMYGPLQVNKEEDSSIAGTIMIFCLSLGLLFGSLISFLVLFIVAGAK